MMSDVKNLWGNFNMPPASVPEYLNLMREQADMLESQTEGLLLGELLQSKSGGCISYHFNIIAPKLKSYRYTLFRVIAGFYTYPVLVYDRAECDDENWSSAGVEYFRRPKNVEFTTLNISPSQKVFLVTPTYSIENSEQFEQSLAKILQSDNTKEVIESLLIKSQSVFS